jgi:DnaJ-class molecular chaperone
MEKQIKRANHKYICDKCKGNGYIKINDMTIQCGKCKSQGELTFEEPTLEELEETAATARLQ